MGGIRLQTKRYSPRSTSRTFRASIAPAQVPSPASTRFVGIRAFNIDRSLAVYPRRGSKRCYARVRTRRVMRRNLLIRIRAGTPASENAEPSHNDDDHWSATLDMPNRDRTCECAQRAVGQPTGIDFVVAPRMRDYVELQPPSGASRVRLQRGRSGCDEKLDRRSASTGLVEFLVHTDNMGRRNICSLSDVIPPCDQFQPIRAQNSHI